MKRAVHDGALIMKPFEVTELASDFSCFVRLVSWIRKDIDICLLEEAVL